jgi:hypothetical protein
MKKALARLRWKTDRELCILAEKLIEQTIRLAEEGRYADAMRSHDTVLRILAVASFSDAEHARLQDRLGAARAVLSQPISAVA